jgi:hypothetical protein
MEELCPPSLLEPRAGVVTLVVLAEREVVSYPSPRRGSKRAGALTWTRPLEHGQALGGLLVQQLALPGSY